MRGSAVLLLAALLLAFAAFWWVRPDRGPTYKVGGGVEVYPCKGGAEPLPVTFSRDGLLAEVHFRGRLHRLSYVGKGLLEDVYAGGGWKLTLDPEANWYGPGGLHLICTW